MRLRTVACALLAAPALLMAIVSPAHADGGGPTPAAQRGTVLTVKAVDGQNRDVVMQPHYSLEVLQSQAFKECLADALIPALTNCDRTNIGQQWIVSGFGGGWYRIQNNNTKSCLDESSAGLRMIKPCWPGDDARSVYQKWAFSGFGDGTNRLQNAWKHHCLSDSGSGRPTMSTTCFSHLDPPASQRHQSWKNIM
ncbi:MAG: hypothetical protein WCA46_13805 [Actinocatenispora sp.]